MSSNDSIPTSSVSAAHTHQLLFSDIDGTCVHYENKGAPFKTLGDALAERCIDGLRSDILRLPPSSSGSRGVISRKTLRMYAAVRALGMKLVLISGCRMSTLLERLPYLPKADAYVCESGGRIFYPVDTNSLTAAPLEEDLTWRELHAAAGPPGQDGLPPHERKGILWDYYRDLTAKGTERLDSRSYTTAFRIKTRVNFSDLPSDLATASNLGVIDVFPKTSGKKNAAIYLMNRFNSSPQNSLFMCGECAGFLSYMT